MPKTENLFKVLQLGTRLKQLKMQEEERRRAQEEEDAFVGALPPELRTAHALTRGLHPFTWEQVMHIKDYMPAGKLTQAAKLKHPVEALRHKEDPYEHVEAPTLPEMPGMPHGRIGEVLSKAPLFRKKETFPERIERKGLPEKPYGITPWYAEGQSPEELEKMKDIAGGLKARVATLAERRLTDRERAEQIAGKSEGEWTTFEKDWYPKYMQKRFDIRTLVSALNAAANPLLGGNQFSAQSKQLRKRLGKLMDIPEKQILVFASHYGGGLAEFKKAFEASGEVLSPKDLRNLKDNAELFYNEFWEEE